MKTCNRCKAHKPLTAFYKRASCLDGHDYTCKACLEPEDRARRQKRTLNAVLGIKAVKNSPKIRLSRKTIIYRTNIKKVIRRAKMALVLGYITAEECNNRIQNHKNKIKESVKSDRSKYFKRVDRLIRSKEKRDLLKHQRRQERLIAKEKKKLEKDLLKKSAQALYERNRRKNDPLYRLACNLRHRTNMALKNGSFTKKSSLNEYLGCSLEKFKAYLESQWRLGMNWDNYGTKSGQWNMDHLVPLASAKTAEEMHDLCHYYNIKPMWAFHNLTKSNKTPEEWAVYKLQHNIDESKQPSVI